MTHKQILKRYIFSMLGYGLAYAGSIIGISFIIEDSVSNLFLKIGIALIPVIFVMLMLRTIWIYVRDVDEAQQYFLQRAVYIAALAVLIFAGSWGVVEMIIDDIPKTPVFWMFPLFFLVFGLATCFGPARGMGKC